MLLMLSSNGCKMVIVLVDNFSPLHPCEVQQHVETNFKVTVARISLLFSFFDKEHVHSCCGRENQAKADPYIHYLDVKCLGLVFVCR